MSVDGVADLNSVDDRLHAGEVSVNSKVDVSSVSRCGDTSVFVKEGSVTVWWAGLPARHRCSDLTSGS